MVSRIALIGENSIEYIKMLLNIWNNGDCAVLIDCQIPPSVAVEMMLEANVGVCYVERKYYDKIHEKLYKPVELFPYEKENSYAQLLPTELDNIFQEKYSRDEAVVIYSSGTTGRAKGIILSHFAINTNADAIINYIKPNNDDCMYIVKNLAHSSTITGELLVALKTRTQILIAPIVMPPRYVLNNIVKYNVSIVCVNPLLLSMYCDEYKKRDYDFSSLKKIYVSGSILSDRIYGMAKTLLCKQEIYNVYGLSEAGPRVAAQRGDCCQGNSVGKAIEGVDIVIVDESGNVLSNGECGIIHVNTPSRFNGYIQGSVKHKSLYQDWLNTGDMGYFDEHGELHIIGRSDDMIIIGAHKIYPFDIEQQIQAFTDIYECVVTMINFRNEDILCCLYVSNLEIRKDIKSVLSTVLSKHEIPKLFVQTKDIPRTRNGKLAMTNVIDIIIHEIQRRIAK